MSILSIADAFPLGRFVARMRRRAAENRSRRLIEELPRHLRKDIGWPDATSGALPDRAWKG